jgi:hypothetical protein
MTSIFDDFGRFLSIGFPPGGNQLPPGTGKVDTDKNSQKSSKIDMVFDITSTGVLRTYRPPLANDTRLRKNSRETTRLASLGCLAFNRVGIAGVER